MQGEELESSGQVSLCWGRVVTSRVRASDRSHGGCFWWHDGRVEKVYFRPLIEVNKGSGGSASSKVALRPSGGSASSRWLCVLQGALRPPGGSASRGSASSRWLCVQGLCVLQGGSASSSGCLLNTRTESKHQQCLKNETGLCDVLNVYSATRYELYEQINIVWQDRIQLVWIRQSGSKVLTAS